MTEIYRADHPARAYWLVEMLEGHGIECEVRDDRAVGSRVTPVVHVLEAADASRAASLVRELIARAGAETHEADWECPRCGEPHEGPLSACWRCGADAPHVAA